MVKRLLTCGEHEPLKALFHGVIGILCLGAATYNIVAYTVRPKRDLRLLTNGIIYGAGVGLEIVQVTRHVATIRKGKGL